MKLAVKSGLRSIRRGERRRGFHGAAGSNLDERFYGLVPACGVICVVITTGAWAASPAIALTAGPPAKINQLIQECVANQLKDMRHPAHRYQYTHVNVTPGSSQTTIEIETPHGMVARLTRVNGKPPSKSQCNKDRAKLARIVSSRKTARQRLKTQQGNLERREHLYEALPHAVLFHYEGVEKGSGLVHLTFKPNPAFSPPTREAGVLQGLAGDIWLDPADQHITKIQGRLVNTVSFGWGILAKLYHGHFTMEQQKQPDGGWRLTTLNVTFHGVILFFKSLNVNMKESYSSYEPVPGNLTLAQAVERLDHIHVDCQ